VREIRRDIVIQFSSPLLGGRSLPLLLHKFLSPVTSSESLKSVNIYAPFVLNLTRGHGRGRDIVLELDGK
jgi:hypothetical protein